MQGGFNTRRHTRREAAELLIQRSELLPPTDRAMVIAAYARGMTTREIAALLKHEPRHIQRRLRRVTRRVLSDRFIFVASHLRSWPAARKRIGTACILHGHSARHAAAETGLPIHTVRQHLEAINTLLEEIRRRETRSDS